jgi:hypothetical protein
MPSLTIWTRLEPVSCRNDLDVGLHARVHDPLWMLARQWQVGEFRAEDAGSPVLARLRAEIAKATRYCAGSAPLSAGSASNYDGTLPLETVVEREAVRRSGEWRRNLRLAAESGQRFLLLLAAHGMTKYRDAFIRTFPFEPGGATHDEGAQHFLAVLSGRAPDGVRLFDSLRAARRLMTGVPGLPSEPSIETADRDMVGEVAEAFISWYEQVVSEPGSDQPSPWTPERMEYGFALAAPGGDGERVLVAREYAEGALDWHAFDECPGASLGATPSQSPPTRLVQTVIPTPVSYRGMPATRWWEFEDAIVDFGSVEVPPSDLVRLLMLDFLMRFSNDWFIMPVELEVGSICTAESLVVVDTFGQQTLVPHYTEVDGAEGKWHLFRASIDQQFSSVTAPGRNPMFLAPTLAGSLHGNPIEEVMLLRDELANLAFGVERITEGSVGQAVNRFEKYQEQQGARRDEDVTPAPEGPSSGAWRYRLATQIPDYWIPLVPVRDADQRSVRLRRGRLLASTGGAATLPAPAGRILEPGTPLSLFEEEVPRAGAKITRAWQLARWIDGSTHLWIGRRKQPGRGEGSSGLRFDVLERRP